MSVFARLVEKWGSAHSWWKSGAIVVWQQAPLQWLPVLLICEMRRGSLLQPPMLPRGIKEPLLWMTLGANEYEYFYKNRHGLPSQHRLGVTVTLVGHGWWEREPLPQEIEDVGGITHTHTHACKINTSVWWHSKWLQHLKVTILSPRYIISSVDANNLI